MTARPGFMRSIARPAILLGLVLGCGDDGSGGSAGTETEGTSEGTGPTAGTDTTTTVGSTGSGPTSGATDTASSTTGGSSGGGSTSATATSGGSTSGGSTGGGTGGGQACVDDHRVVAFLANWQACPTADQLAAYSHVVVSFAVTYTWNPNGNICDQSCTIGAVPGCTGSDLATLVSDLHAAGVQVLLSFGGAGMGGIWEGTCGNMTKCWDYCLDKADSLSTQLTDLVIANDLDGVDIDYEYCLHTATHTGFVEDLTTSLRTKLDAASPGEHKLITHAPMDSELNMGDPYYQIVKNTTGAIDFLMPQYYNGGQSPFTAGGLSSIHDHYDDLVSDVYGGDASRVVFGYCIEPGCNPVATQPEALQVTQQFDQWYPDNGGVFFWAHPDDTGAWFSKPFRDYYDQSFCE